MSNFLNKSNVILKYVFMSIFVTLCFYNVLFCIKVHFHVSGLLQQRTATKRSKMGFYGSMFDVALYSVA